MIEPPPVEIESPMVERAEECPVHEIGWSAQRPGCEVSDFAPAWGSLASRPDTAGIPHGECATLRPTEQPTRPPKIEDLAVASAVYDLALAQGRGQVL